MHIRNIYATFVYTKKLTPMGKTMSIKTDKAAMEKLRRERTEELKEQKRLVIEMRETMLKRAGLTKKDVLEEGLRAFVANNLDLLTPAEIEKYRNAGLLMR